MKRKSKFYLYSIITIVVAGAVAAYYLLPNMLASTNYPLCFTDLVITYSAKHRVPPDLTMAIIKQESNCNPQAESYMGARGLMQVMPPTGKTIAKGVEDQNYYPDKLYDPETSIKYGTWYIRTLLDRYNDNAAAALTAYNAGSGNVDRWFFSGMFGSGNSYAQRVLEYQKIYASYYGRELFGVDANLKIEKPKQSFLWNRMVKDLIGVLYSDEQ